MLDLLNSDDIDQPPFAPPILKAGKRLIAQTANILLFLRCQLVAWNPLLVSNGQIHGVDNGGATIYGKRGGNAAEIDPLEQNLGLGQV